MDRSVALGFEEVNGAGPNRIQRGCITGTPALRGEPGVGQLASKA